MGISPPLGMGLKNVKLSSTGWTNELVDELQKPAVTKFPK